MTEQTAFYEPESLRTAGWFAGELTPAPGGAKSNSELTFDSPQHPDCWHPSPCGHGTTVKSAECTVNWSRAAARSQSTRQRPNRSHPSRDGTAMLVAVRAATRTSTR